MMRTWRRRKKKKRNPHLYPAFLYKLMLVINYFDHKGINKQAGAAPGFGLKARGLEEEEGGRRKKKYYDFKASSS